MPKLIIAVDCSFPGYAPLSGRPCTYNQVQTISDIANVLGIVSSECGGKAAFLIPTSPYLRRDWGDAFFTNAGYTQLWKEAASRGAEFGIRLHEEEPDGSCLYYGYPLHLEKTLVEHVQLLTRTGLSVTCESTGYFCTNEWLIPAMESAGVYVNLDNTGDFNRVSGVDWSSAPDKSYFFDRADVTHDGESRVLSVPLGGIGPCRGEDGLMTGPNSVRYLRSLWNAICAGPDSDCVSYMWVQAGRAQADKGKLRSILRFMRANGAEFVLPSEAYRDHCSVPKKCCGGGASES